MMRLEIGLKAVKLDIQEVYMYIYNIQAIQISIIVFFSFDQRGILHTEHTVLYKLPFNRFCSVVHNNTEQ